MACSLIKPSELEKSFLNEKWLSLNVNRAGLKNIIHLLHVHSEFKPKQGFAVDEKTFKCTSEGGVSSVLTIAGCFKTLWSWSTQE